MDRMEFLKRMCGFGICGCALSGLGAADVLAASGPTEPPAPPPTVPDQRLAFARYQIAKLAGFMAADPAAASCAQLVERTGRECAKLGRMGTTFKGNPEGYLAAAHESYGTEFLWDRERGIITATVTEGECGCPLVDASRTPAFWCNCSVGYQREVFEAVFGRPVQVSLKGSKLSGGKTCVFEMKLT
jgi:hypothetical protein